jgi:hypothetical protein
MKLRSLVAAVAMALILSSFSFCISYAELPSHFVACDTLGKLKKTTPMIINALDQGIVYETTDLRLAYYVKDDTLVCSKAFVLLPNKEERVLWQMWAVNGIYFSYIIDQEAKGRVIPEAGIAVHIGDILMLNKVMYAKVDVRVLTMGRILLEEHSITIRIHMHGKMQQEPFAPV